MKVPLDVVIATRNRHKARELTALLRVPGVRWRSLEHFPDAPEIPESGTTFRENAVTKAVAVARATGHPALADDSGLEVAALHGAPGVRSARFAGRQGDDAANNAKLLRCLQGVIPSRRGARYRCVLALAGPTNVVAVTEGALAGRIASRPAGRGGFGYDPLFLVPRSGKTVAQLSADAKNRISHRAKAAARMQRHLRRWAVRYRSESKS